MSPCATRFQVRAVVVAPAGTALPGEYLVDGYRALQLAALPVGAEPIMCRKCAAVITAGEPWLTQVSTGLPPRTRLILRAFHLPRARFCSRI